MAVSVEATLRAWHYLNPHLVPIFSSITAGVVDESRNQLRGSNFGTAASVLPSKHVKSAQDLNGIVSLSSACTIGGRSCDSDE